MKRVLLLTLLVFGIGSSAFADFNDFRPWPGDRNDHRRDDRGRWDNRDRRGCFNDRAIANEAQDLAQSAREMAGTLRRSPLAHNLAELVRVSMDLRRDAMSDMSCERLKDSFRDVAREFQDVKRIAQRMDMRAEHIMRQFRQVRRDFVMLRETVMENGRRDRHDRNDRFDDFWD